MYAKPVGQNPFARSYPVYPGNPPVVQGLTQGSRYTNNQLPQQVTQQYQPVEAAALDAAIKDAAGSTPSQPTDVKYNLVTKAQVNAAQLAAIQQTPAQQVPAQQVVTPQVPVQQVPAQQVLLPQAPGQQVLTHQVPAQQVITHQTPAPNPPPQQPPPQTSALPSAQQAAALNMLQGFTNPMVDTQAMAAFDLGHGWQPCVDEIGNDGYNHNPQGDYVYGDTYFP